MTSRPLAALRRILVVKLSSLGDVVHVTPCLRALRRACPSARIAMAVDRRYVALVRGSPYVDEVIEGDAREGRLGAWLEPWRQLAGRRRPRFDLAIDFQGTRRSAAWVYASGARVRAGRAGGVGGRPGRRPGWQRVVRPDLARHAVQVCADIARALGVRVADLDPELVVSPEADRRCGTRLAAAGLPERHFVLVNPLTRWPAKTWPLERYRELVSRLVRDRVAPIVVHAAPGEEDAVEAFRAAGIGVGVATGLPLDEALALFRRARLLVTGDTGPMHCAAALGTPVVALFGPTWPERTGPWGPGHRVVQRSRPATPDAFRTEAGRRHIEAIDVAAVHREVRAALDDAPPGRRGCPAGRAGQAGQGGGPPPPGASVA
jgi:ADP-heptose:LPS heptosyltransferase